MDIVRETVLAMEEKPDPGYRGGDMTKLPSVDAAELTKVLPSIQKPWVFEVCADELRSWDYRPAIPVLIKALDHKRSLKPYAGDAAMEPLQAWGWVAFGPLLHGEADGPYTQRLACLQILANHGRDRPEDARLSDRFLKESRSESAEFRLAAVRGLSGQTGRIEGWMESTHASTMDNAAAFERLAEMVYDEDGNVAKTAYDSEKEWLWSRHQGEVVAPQYEGLPFAGHIDERNNLSHICSAGTDPFERAAALSLLCKFPGRHREAVGALSDVDALVRRLAVFLLEMGLTSEARRDVILKTESPLEATRLAAAQVLAADFAPESREALHKLAADPSAEIRETARKGLRKWELRSL